MNILNKKILWTLFFLLSFSILISAQVGKRFTWISGVSTGLADFNEEGPPKVGLTYHIKPGWGYFINNNLALGLQFNYSSIAFGGSPYDQYGIGPFMRFMGENVYIQFDQEFGFTSELFSYSKYIASIGYTFFITKSFAVEPQIFYAAYNESGKSFDYDGLGLGLVIQFFTRPKQSLIQ